MKNIPEQTFAEYEAARKYKLSLCEKGLWEQNRLNERFYVGDQWRGASCGDRPLVRHNVIKRIGDCKMSAVMSAPLSVNYYAEGFSLTEDIKKNIKKERKTLSAKKDSLYAPLSSENEIGLMVSALNSYRATTANRVGLDEIAEKVLRDAYITGTGIIYTYFDPDIKTGLYADKIGGTPILGDIVCQRVKVEDIYFGDPTNPDIEKQPYIIIAEQRPASEVFANKENRNSSEKVTVFTRLYKQADEQGNAKVYALKTTENTVIRQPFCLGISRYPLSVFCWERRDNCVYGESEITYLIPNQIAINRMITASVWASMTSGMPMMLVNGDLVPGEITNEPGQIIRAYGTPEELATAVKFITPPDISGSFTDAVNNLITNTLTQSGANEAALGDLEASNTSAILALRDAANRHIQPLKNRFYRFMGDVSLVWAEFFFALYGKRGLKICDENGVWYFPFDAARYRSVVLSVNVSAREGISADDSKTASLLATLLDKGAITPSQYLRWLPSGLLPDAVSLAEEIEKGGSADEGI